MLPRPRLAAALLALLVTLAGCGGSGSATPDSTATAPSTAADSATPTIDARFPVDGERALALRCWGDGSPTVVFDAGSGVPGIGGLENSTIPAELAKSTRFCAYDRAGLGLSDPAPDRKRGLDDSVDDLHALLEAADVPGPYVLLGWSAGGFIAYHYAGRYPDDVAGLAMLDVPPGLGDIPPDQIPAWDDPDNAEHTDFAALARWMTEERLPIPAVPVTVVTATDGLSAGNPDAQKIWLEGSSDPEQVILEGAHEIHGSNPEGVLAAINDLLGRAGST